MEVSCKLVGTSLEIEGIDRVKEEKLRARKKRKPNQTELDKWDAVYGILFPGEALPPPCEKILQPSVEHHANRTFQAMVQLRNERKLRLKPSCRSSFSRSPKQRVCGGSMKEQ